MIWRSPVLRETFYAPNGWSAQSGLMGWECKKQYYCACAPTVRKYFNVPKGSKIVLCVSDKYVRNAVKHKGMIWEIARHFGRGYTRQTCYWWIELV